MDMTIITISSCGYQTTMMTNLINGNSAITRLQFGTSKCIEMHIGRTCNEYLCKDVSVDAWKIEEEKDQESGKHIQSEVFGGPVKNQTPATHSSTLAFTLCVMKK